MAAKETIHIRRDPRTLYLALAMPVVMLVLFGYGVSTDVEHAPLAIADGDHTAESRALVRAFTVSGELDRVAEIAPGDAERIFRHGDALAALVIPKGYGADVARGADGRAQLLVDAVDPVTTNQLLSKAEAIARSESRSRVGGAGASRAPPLRVETVTRYNPAGRSSVFIVPGLAAYLLAIVAVLLTALTVAGEWERGSMEQLFASPVGRLEIIAGKLLPYLGLGLVQLLLVLTAGTWLFDVPIAGGLATLFAAGFLFLAAMLGQGLFISVIAKNQLVATQAGTLSALLPSLLLSGMIFPLENMPLPLQLLSRAIPARYLVHALRGAMLKGNGLGVLWPDLAALAAFAVVILALATARFQRRVA
jgi:ABC-2 type transport system permease protein